jgi:hypothetical protein
MKKFEKENNEAKIEDAPLYKDLFTKEFLQWLFYVIFVFIIGFDMYVFTYFNDWGSSISILILELILLAMLGRLCDIDYLEVLTEKILESYGNGGSGDK